MIYTVWFHYIFTSQLFYFWSRDIFRGLIGRPCDDISCCSATVVFFGRRGGFRTSREILNCWETLDTILTRLWSVDSCVEGTQFNFSFQFICCLSPMRSKIFAMTTPAKLCQEFKGLRIIQKKTNYLTKGRKTQRARCHLTSGLVYQSYHQ